MRPRDAVAEEIRRLVGERRLGAGDRLPSERDLALRLGRSRPAIREGLGRLVDLGVVEARRGSGLYVAPVDLEALLDVRVELERYAAAQAAQRAGEEQVAALEALLERLRGALDDPPAFAAADAEVHALIARAARNPVLVSVLDGLAEMASYSRERTRVDRALREATLGDVEELLAALGSQDAARAATAMEAHLGRVRETLARGVANGG